jgi:hypothetical protein
MNNRSQVKRPTTTAGGQSQRQQKSMDVSGTEKSKLTVDMQQKGGQVIKELTDNQNIHHQRVASVDSHDMTFNEPINTDRSQKQSRTMSRLENESEQPQLGLSDSQLELLKRDVKIEIPTGLMSSDEDLLV